MPPEAATSNLEGGGRPRSKLSNEVFSKGLHFSMMGTWMTSVSMLSWHLLSSSSSFLGRSMKRNLGRMSMKKTRTQGASLCVTGERKLTFKTAIVMTTDRVHNNIVKSKYLPNRGTVMEVGGMISTNSRKKTVKESRIEMQSDTFSPESEGK